MGMQLESEDLTLEIEDLTRNMVDFTGRIEAFKKLRISLKGNWKTIPSDQTWLENPRSHGLVSCWESHRSFRVDVRALEKAKKPLCHGQWDHPSCYPLVMSK